MVATLIVRRRLPWTTSCLSLTCGCRLNVADCLAPGQCRLPRWLCTWRRLLIRRKSIDGTLTTTLTPLTTRCSWLNWRIRWRFMVSGNTGNRRRRRVTYSFNKTVVEWNCTSDHGNSSVTRYRRLCLQLKTMATLVVRRRLLRLTSCLPLTYWRHLMPRRRRRLRWWRRTWRHLRDIWRNSNHQHLTRNNHCCVAYDGLSSSAITTFY